MSATVFPVRSNLHLWLLTGRSSDFFNPSLNMGYSYSVDHTPKSVLQLRSLLRLADTSTDFHALSVLGATRMATAFLRDLPAETDGVFAPDLLRLPGIESTHPMLPASGYSWPKVDGARAGRDGFTRVLIRYLSAARARIETDAGGAEDSACRATANGGVFRLSVDALPSYGIHAIFEVPAWDADTVVAVRLAPTRYPFSVVASRVRDSSDARRLMIEEGMMAAFSETTNPALKVGLAGIAIMRRMQRLINAEQVGFRAEYASAPTDSEPLAKSFVLDPSFEASLAYASTDPENPGGFDV